MPGSPDEIPDLYRSASPVELLPLGVPQLLVHSVLDEDVPVEISRRYVQAARAAGDAVDYIELEDAAHMDFVDPRSRAHETVCGWLSHRRGS